MFQTSKMANQITMQSVYLFRGNAYPSRPRSITRKNIKGRALRADASVIERPGKVCLNWKVTPGWRLRCTTWPRAIGNGNDSYMSTKFRCKTHARKLVPLENMENGFYKHSNGNCLQTIFSEGDSQQTMRMILHQWYRCSMKIRLHCKNHLENSCNYKT